MRAVVLLVIGVLPLACADNSGVAAPSSANAGQSGNAGASAGIAGGGGAASGGALAGGAGADASGAAGGPGPGGGGASGGVGGVGGMGGAGAGGMPGVVQPTLKVMTFNLRYGTAPDGENAWELRKPLTFDVFNRQDADLVGIQEGLDQQLQDIDAAVPGYARIGVGRDDGKTKGEYSAIYYKTARLDVDASGTFWFSDTPEVVGSKTWGNELPRICSWAHFVEKSTGYGFYQFNVHLDAYVQVAREKSVVLLMQRVAARPVGADAAIVTGDFNAAEDNLANQFMRGAALLEGSANPLPLSDSYRVIHPSETEVGTFHGFEGGTSGPKIDYVYLLPSETALAAAIDRTHDANRYPSDHYPVTATIRLPAPL
jgi:endonuclease/exonuclease/phosphatase family metal-dependent hydrolase